MDNARDEVLRRYLVTSDYAKSFHAFNADPMFNRDDYIEPPSGQRTFNQFFGRYGKPGRRSLVDIADLRVIVSSVNSMLIDS